MSYPILYKPDETVFTSLGVGVLIDAVEPLVTEEANGIYELTMQYPVDSIMYSEIKTGMIIKADASTRSKNQRFKIIRITTPAKGLITIHAEHVSYLTYDSVLEPVVNYSGTAQMALTDWSNNIIGTHPFTVYSDIVSEGSGSWKIDDVENSRRALGGVRGSLLDTYGGEYFFDNYHIALYANRGKDNGALISYGKNLIDLTQEEEISNVYTSIYPYVKLEVPENSPSGTEEEILTLPEKIVDSNHINKFTHRKVKVVDFSDEKITTVERLRERTIQYLEANGYGIPNVNLKVNFMDLATTVDYEDSKVVEEINLFDVVTINFSKLNLRRKSKVIKTVWEVLNDRYRMIEIGERKANLTTVITEDIKDNNEKNEIIIDNIRKDIINSYWNSDGFNYDLGTDNEYGLPAGYYSFDRPIDQNPDRAIYMGAGTMLIANKKNPDGSWNWQTMANGDGIVADVVTAGVLKGLGVRIDLDRGTFLIGRSEEDYALYYDGTSLKMDFTTNSSNVVVGDSTLDQVLDGLISGGGIKGDSGVSNSLIVNPSYIIKDNKTSELDPSSVDISSVTRVGDSAQSSKPSHFVVYKKTKNSEYVVSYESTANESTLNYSVTKDTTSIKIEWYENNTKTTLLDVQTIPVISDGVDAITGFLTNESITFPADHTGLVTEYLGNTGRFRVFDGTVDMNSKTVYKVESALNISAVITPNGDYTLSSMNPSSTIKSAKVVLSATFKGVVISKEIVVSKTIQGKDGTNGHTPVKGTDYFDGVNGTNGVSSYLFVKYSLLKDSGPILTDPNNAKYIGISTNTTGIEPTSRNSYIWNLIKGTDGVKGENGTDGKSSFLHIKYSNDGGKTLTTNNGETVGSYIGTYVDSIPEDSLIVTLYTWNLVRGKDGTNGYTPVKGIDYFDGTNGTDGKNSYLYVKYSLNSNGYPMTDDPVNARYIGTTVSSSSNAPTLYTEYTWVLVKGTNGVKGENGTDGKSSFLHIKYSNDGGKNFTASNGEVVGSYIGTYVDFTELDSTLVGSYTWNLVKGTNGTDGKDGRTPTKGVDYFDGTDGKNGTNGVNGTNGKNSYLYIKYSQNSNGYPMTDSPDSAKYIGTSITTSSTTPTLYTDYTWVLVKGTDGVKGANGVNGKSSFLHIKYSNDGGKNFTASNGEVVGEYIGTYVDFTELDSTLVGSYTWNLVKGKDGIDGKDGRTPIKGSDYFDGKDGTDGDSSYLWVRYSQNSTGNPMTDSPSNAKYIGTSTTKVPTAPVSYNEYSWVLVKGTDGIKGANGADGKSSFLHVKYSNDGGRTFTDSSGETAGSYIGTYVDFTELDSTLVGSYTWNLVKGKDGLDGKDGVGIRNTSYSYQTHTNGTSAPSGSWSQSVIEPIKGRYMWIRTVLTYTDNTSSTTYNVSYSPTDGQAGSNGSDGNGISSVDIEYQLHTNGSTPPTSTWGTSIPTPISGRYLWTRTITNYTNRTRSTSYSTSYYATDGQQGPSGSAGISVISTNMAFYLSTSSTSLMGGSWSDLAPKWDSDKYIWTKTITTYSNSTKTESNPINVTGGKGLAGSNGLKGADGRAVSSVKEQFYLSNSRTVQTGGSWSDTSPIWSYGKYVWTRLHISFTNPSGVTVTNGEVDTSWEAIDNIRVGGNNLLRNSGTEVTNASYPISVYELTEDIEDGAEVTISIKGSLGRSSWGIYNSGGSVSVASLTSSNINENGIYTTTFKWRKGASSNTSLYVYPMPNDEVESTIVNIQLERGNVYTPWTEAIEDTIERINGKADQGTVDDLENSLSNLETITATKEELGEVITSLNNYRDALDSAEIDAITAKEDITALLNRSIRVENNLGEFVERWNFLNTYMTAGDEGLMIQEVNGSTGIRISTDRIDFIDGSGEPVAYITNQVMRINRGIFVKSAQIGEHKIETISGGHTIWQWIQ